MKNLFTNNKLKQFIILFNKFDKYQKIIVLFY